MAEETSPIDREPKTLQPGVEDSKASLADKLETLGDGVKDTWHGATEAATRMATGVKSAAETAVHAVQGAAETTVHAVQEAAETTVHAVQGAAHSTNKAMGWAFDLPAHVRRNPWAMMGGAMFLGLAAGYLIGRLRR